MYTESKTPMPSKTMKGRPDKYNLRDMALGSCREYTSFDLKRKRFKVNDETVFSLRGSLFSSASNYGIKIVTSYKNGVLKVWRKA